jgi:hypothetical protein
MSIKTPVWVGVGVSLVVGVEPARPYQQQVAVLPLREGERTIHTHKEEAAIEKD